MSLSASVMFCIKAAAKPSDMAKSYKRKIVSHTRGRLGIVSETIVDRMAHAQHEAIYIYIYTLVWPLLDACFGDVPLSH